MFHQPGRPGGAGWPGLAVLTSRVPASSFASGCKANLISAVSNWLCLTHATQGAEQALYSLRMKLFCPLAAGSNVSSHLPALPHQ